MSNTPNKNYIIGGIALLIIIVILVFVPGGDESAVPNGIKELTKETAAAAIEQDLKTKPDNNQTTELCQRGQGFQAGGVQSSGWSVDAVDALEKAGLVKIISRQNDAPGLLYAYRNYIFTLTEAMRPYLAESKNGGSSCYEITMGEPDRVEVTELIEAGIEKTEKTIYAKATVKYKATPAGEAYNKAWASQDELVQRNFVFLNGRWHLE